MRMLKERAEKAKRHLLPRQKKQPRQSRAIFTVNVILEAASQLFQEGGIEAVTTRQVAQRAGVGIGTLYEYFPNRDAILIQLITRSMRKHCEQLTPLYHDVVRQDRSLAELFSLSAAHAIDMDRTLMRYGREFHRRYARHFYFGHYYHAPCPTLSQQKVLDFIEDATARMLDEHGGEVGEPNVALAAFLISRAVRGMVNIVIEERPELLDAPSFPALLQRVMLAIADFRESVPERPACEPVA